MCLTLGVQELLPSLHQSAGVLRDSLVGVASSSLLELVSELESNITVESGRSSNSRCEGYAQTHTHTHTTDTHTHTHTNLQCYSSPCLGMAGSVLNWFHSPLDSNLTTPKLPSTQLVVFTYIHTRAHTRAHTHTHTHVHTHARTHTVVSASIRVNNALTTYIDDTRTRIRCEIGRCLSLAEKYDLFTSALCADIVPGMDIYWTSLVIILSISIVLIPLGLLLASRFIDLDFEKASDKSATFHQAEAIILQLRAFVWLMFSISINLWLVGTISRDRRFHDECAGTSECCASCVWGFGVVFAILSILVGGATQIYQCVVIYRIKSESMLDYS